MFLLELPSSSSTSLVNSFHLTEFFFISFLVSPSITSLIHSSICYLVAMPLSSNLIFAPTFHTLTINFALVIWSVHYGIATIGTPKLNASSVEFHPQWVIKRPIALWANTNSSWGHQLTTSPFFSVSSRELPGSFFLFYFSNNPQKVAIAIL